MATQGPFMLSKPHFLPQASYGLRVLSLPASVSELVHAITHQPFQLELPR